MSEIEKRTLSDKFMLRLPDGMRDRIKAASEANNRSMNAEIVAILEEKFPPPNPPSIDEILGHAALLDLFNTLPEDRPAKVLALNERLAEAGTVERLTLRKGKIKTVRIGELWGPDMAIEP
ncbi:Arc family DNA-binding protein [Paenirhodobacter populi]|uniref:Arc family DNA-binding protein n=1 Tax=Paenirhodobacter populi TaxID=2306993 RepID=A0A443JDG0_9RHOB|nr:Arc family DNA-binding protein [Sinirhodobacter populi]RWR18514.1 Arc family DNA-binding protein [Sinirhodobacter populi]